MDINKRERLYTSKEDLLLEASKAIGHKVSEFNINNRSLSKSNKGVIGQIVEEGIFHYPVNSKPEADFADLGVELKVTGIERRAHDYKIKERLVLNIINYMEESDVDFEHSSFWLKNKSLLLLFYLYDNDLDNYDFEFFSAVLHSFSEKDLEIIKKDWEIIHKKITDGLAHTISEADTLYLGAVSKGKGHGLDLREQPFSNIKAKQRAYSLKKSYMDTVVQAILKKEMLESIFTYEDLLTTSFESLLESKLKPYYGKSESELFKLFGISTSAKSRFNVILSRMLGLHGVINKSEEFCKAGILLKTIRVEENGSIKEHMSFPSFTFTDICNETWESSFIREYFDSKKFLFVVFRKKNGSFVFEKIKFWNMPIDDIENFVKPVFKKCVSVIKSGTIVKSFDGQRYLTNFPGSSFNHVCHIRPHDRKSVRFCSGVPLPVSDKLTGFSSYTRHCFWLDRNYVRSVVEE